MSTENGGIQMIDRSATSLYPSSRGIFRIHFGLAIKILICFTSNPGKIYFYGMQIKSRLLRIITILFLAVCGVLSLVLLEVFGSKPKDIRVPIPAKANWVVRIDAASLLKESVYTVLFDSQDEKLLQSIRDIAENRVERESEYPPLYINFRSEMVFYGIQDDRHRFVGMLIQLENAELFRQNIGAYLEDGQTVAVKGTTALLLNKMDEFPLNKSIQQKLTENYLEKGTFRYVRQSQRADNEWISLEAKSFLQTGKNVQAGLHFEPHALRLDGRYELDETLAQPRYDLKSTGLFFSSAIIPDGLADSINKLLPTGSYQFPELQAVTMDYNGLVIMNTNHGIQHLPQLNAILESKTPVSLEEIKKSIPVEFIGPNNTLVFPTVTYHLQQLDPKTIFIGLDPNSIIRKPQSTVICIKGKLNPLVNIKADRLITMGIQLMVPQLTSARSFIEHTKSVDFSIKRAGKSYKVSGNLEFVNDAYPLSEISRLLIDLNVIQ